LAAAIYHGLNGLRVILTSFGIGVTRQKELFYALLALSIFGSIFFALRMFAG
jgi:succinate dehydrogenase/fumarate reductase cytochrome b subunit